MVKKSSCAVVIGNQPVLVEQLKSWPELKKVFLVSSRDDSDVVIKETSPEKIEESFDKLYSSSKCNLHKFNKLGNSCIAFVDGSDIVSACSLRLLQKVKDADIRIIFLLRPTPTYKNDVKLNRKVVYGVLQEYARSGVFKEICIVDDYCLEKMIPATTLSEIETKKTELLLGTYKMLLAYREQEGVLKQDLTPPNCARIYTLGSVDLETGKENLFYEIFSPILKAYYYLVSKGDYEKQSGLLQEAREKLNRKQAVDYVYDIFISPYDSKYLFVIPYSDQIQEIITS